MFCQKCGKQISDNAKFCEHCGAKVESQPVKDSEDRSFASNESDMSKEIATLTSEQGEKNVEQKDNSKSTNKESTNNITYTVAFIILLIIGGCIKGYNSYVKQKTETTLLRYIESKKSEENSLPLSSIKKPEFLIKRDSIRQEFHNIAAECNNELPEDQGNGITLIKCDLQDYDFVYTFQWGNKVKKNFSDKYIEGLKKSILQGMKEAKNEDKEIEQFIYTMFRNGYKYRYDYLNEKNDTLFKIEILPSDVLYDFK